MTKDTPDGEEETWIVKTYFTTEETFPTVLRRSEIVLIETTEISPVESALREVEAKTKELALMHVKYSTMAKTNQPVSLNAMSTALHLAVEPPPNGVTHFKRMFLSGEYEKQNPERQEYIQRLPT